MRLNGYQLKFAVATVLALSVLLTLAFSDLGGPGTKPAKASGVDLTLLLKLHYDRISYSGGFLASDLVTDDVEVQRGTACSALVPCVGKAQYAIEIARNVSLKARWTFLSAEQSGETVTARVEYTDLGIQSVVPRTVANITATFRGDKIAKIVGTGDSSDPQTAQFQSIVGRVSTPAAALFRSLERGDIAGAMSVFSDDAVFEGFGLCATARCAGKTAIQREIEREVADKGAFLGLSETFRYSGETLTSGNEIRSDSIRAAGVERLRLNRTVEVRDGKIVLLRLIPDTSDAQTARFFGGAPGVRPPSTGDAGLASRTSREFEPFIFIGLVAALSLLVTIRSRKERT